MKILGKIIYTIDKNHPDIKYMQDWKKGKTYKFEDTYFFDPNKFFSIDHFISSIKNDLKLVAGGGYDSKHIHNIKFEIRKVYN